MAGLTTHVLDVSRGQPADGVRLQLYELAGGSDRKLIADVVTNADGRTDAPLLDSLAMVVGSYELVFFVKDYFVAHLEDSPFLDRVPVRFAITDAAAGYHVPLLVTPWAYSTYRGN